MYSLRIPFALPPREYIYATEQTLAFEGRQWSIDSEYIKGRDRPVAAARTPAFVVSGFPSEDEAQRYLPRALTIIAALMLERRLTFDPSRVVGPVVEGTQASFADGNTIVIHASGVAPRFSFGEVTVSRIADGDGTLSHLRELAGLPDINIGEDRIALALELYRAHARESSIKSKFIGLVTVLECLAENRRRPAEVVTVIEHIRVQWRLQKEFYPKDLHDRIDGDLARLREQSISDSIVVLVNHALQPADATAAEELQKNTKAMYGTRSVLVHEGRSSNQNFSKAYKFAQEVVPRVLLAYMRNHDARNDAP